MGEKAEVWEWEKMVKKRLQIKCNGDVWVAYHNELFKKEERIKNMLSLIKYRKKNYRKKRSETFALKCWFCVLLCLNFFLNTLSRSIASRGNVWFFSRKLSFLRSSLKTKYREVGRKWVQWGNSSGEKTTISDAAVFCNFPIAGWLLYFNFIPRRFDGLCFLFSPFSGGPLSLLAICLLFLRERSLSQSFFYIYLSLSFCSQFLHPYFCL